MARLEFQVRESTQLSLVVEVVEDDVAAGLAVVVAGVGVAVGVSVATGVNVVAGVGVTAGVGALPGCHILKDLQAHPRKWKLIEAKILESENKKFRYSLHVGVKYVKLKIFHCCPRILLHVIFWAFGAY